MTPSGRVVGKTKTVVSADTAPVDMPVKDPLRRVGGSASLAFNSQLLRLTIAALYVHPEADPEVVDRGMAAISSALAAFKPKDEIEGMLAAQAVALHFSAMVLAASNAPRPTSRHSGSGSV